ncbi:para-nitrobenzyl esterase [Corynespora cassiicola Philippines]|uniref:Carboxylic ester hydrolase n=1 Tax=Corynespora cassiicola Philippines TaxID=1448308 RepID=A0A2T2P9J0_CORCC|nr:para-nitrobenzyl esterase [Corynespora cassiicola Philippines]
MATDDAHYQPLLNEGEAPSRAALLAQSLWSKFRANLLTLMAVLFSFLLAVWLYSNSAFSRPAGPPDYSHDPAQPLLVNLPGYGKFLGTQVQATLQSRLQFPKPIDAWLGIDFSTQPINESRFEPVTWPEQFTGTKDAKDYGPICVQSPYNALTHSEACLNFNLYRTSGIPYSQKLPVFIFLHGGAFVFGNGRSFDGAAFVNRSSEPLIVVTPQYRLGAFGSLPSKLFEDEGLLNLGLRDQRMLLEFMRKYVSYFGGDPDRITLGGQSAGAHSVGVHLFHDYGKDQGNQLFSQAILSSGAPTARAFPPATFPLSVRQYDQFMEQVGCPKSPNDAALACLKAAPLASLQQTSADIYSQSNYNITWPWQPVSPGPLIEKRGSISGIDETFFKIPTLITSTNDEGTVFSPQNLVSNADFINFMANLLPGLTEQDLKDLEKLYPDPNLGIGPYIPDTSTYVSPQYERISAAYGDYSYICPVQETAYRMSKAGVPVYKARFNTPNYAPAYLGVPHASDAAYFNGVPNVEFPEISELYANYYASFIVSGDPNKHAISGAAYWQKYEKLGGKELVVGNAARGGVHLEDEGEGIRMEQCAWWRDPERMVRMNK